MGKIQINIINLKCNNVFSLGEACKKVGYKVKIINDPKVYKKGKTDILFLPGVGAFNEAIKTLRKKGFDELVYEHVNKKKLLVGICLGMQLLFNSSSEFKFSRGLGLINGQVTRLKKEKNINFPHVGWKEIRSTKKHIWSKIDYKFFYFIHSFFCKPKDDKISTSFFNYGKQQICSSVQKSNIIGTQFPPEKSGLQGLKFLNEIKKFL